MSAAARHALDLLLVDIDTTLAGYEAWLHTHKWALRLAGRRNSKGN